MKLWLLRPKQDLPENREQNPWRPWYDKAFGYVIRAETEEEARKLAANDCGDEGEKAWLLPEFSTCIPLTEVGSSEIIIKDFASA